MANKIIVYGNTKEELETCVKMALEEVNYINEFRIGSENDIIPVKEDEVKCGKGDCKMEAPNNTMYLYQNQAILDVFNGKDLGFHTKNAILITDFLWEFLVSDSLLSDDFTFLFTFDKNSHFNDYVFKNYFDGCNDYIEILCSVKRFN